MEVVEMTRGAIALMLCALCLAGNSYGSSPQDKPSTFEQDVRELLFAMRVDELGATFIEAWIQALREEMPHVPIEYWNAISQRLDATELLELMVPVYSKHFSQDEVRKLTTIFTQTAVGEWWHNLNVVQGDLSLEASDFSEDALKSIASFLDSPLGITFDEKMTVIAAEGKEIGTEYARTVDAQVRAELRLEGIEVP